MEIDHKVSSKLSEYQKMTDDIPEWNPRDEIKDMLKQWNSFSMIISGSRMSGKSQMLKYLLHHPESNLAREFDIIVVFSKTIESGFYQSFLDSKLMYKQFRPEVIEDLNKLYYEFKAKGKKFKYLAIFDDIIDQRIKYNETIGDCFYMGRHRGCSVIMITQKLSMFATGWFTNTMIFIILYAGSRNENKYVADKLVVDAVYKSSEIKNEKDAEHKAYLIITKICEDHNALIITPYCKQKIHQFKAKLCRDKKNKPKSIFENFISNN